MKENNIYYDISFVITTYNKCAYLETTINSVIKHLSINDELIVIDGGSNDGTQELLNNYSNLYENFIYHSEPDWGEGHGYNKSLFLATKSYIFIVTDDDEIDISRIRGFLNEQEVCPDIIFSAGVNKTTAGIEFPILYDKHYRNWVSKSYPFAFCCIGLLIKRNIVPRVGLFSSSIKRTDAEFSLRITSLKGITIAYNAKFSWKRIQSTQSISHRYKYKMHFEFIRFVLFYSGIPGVIRMIFDRLSFSHFMRFFLEFLDHLSSICSKLRKRIFN